MRLAFKYYNTCVQSLLILKSLFNFLIFSMFFFSTFSHLPHFNNTYLYQIRPIPIYDFQPYLRMIWLSYFDDQVNYQLHIKSKMKI